MPIAESQTLVAPDDMTYGGGKVHLENVLLDAGRLPVTVLRPAAVCGRGSRHLREWWLVKRVLDGRTILPLKDGGRSRFHPSSTGNIAALAVHSLGLTSSQVLNAADPDCPAVLDIATCVASAMNRGRAGGSAAGPRGRTQVSLAKSINNEPGNFHRPGRRSAEVDRNLPGHLIRLRSSHPQAGNRGLQQRKYQGRS